MMVTKRYKFLTNRISTHLLRMENVREINHNYKSKVVNEREQ